MKKIITVLVSTLLVSLLVGCGGTAQQENEPPKNVSAQNTIKIAGSTSVAPLMKKLKADYEQSNSDISIEIQETGSSAGITSAIEKIADIGMSSRDLTDDEKSKGVNEIAIALDGIAVIVNTSNTVENLTNEQIRGIFSGEITNWKEVGGEDKEIIIVSREPGSGTKGAFEELIKLEKEVTKADGTKGKESILSPNALTENSTGGVKSNIAGSKYAIGYISLGTLDETVKGVSVNGVECSVDTVKDKTYPIARPFLICTQPEINDETKQFIDFILSDKGQEIVTAEKYISVK